MRKAGLPIESVVSVSPELTGLSSTFSGEYRLEGDTGAFTPFPAGFVEVKPGTYSSTLTIPTAGNYLVVVTSTDDRISDSTGWVTVTAATIDDVKAAIAAAQLDITDIASKVDALDDTIIANIASTATSIDDKLIELKGLMSDENDPAVVSLRELLLDIQAAGSSRDSVITALTSYTDDLEAMIRGDEFMADGTTPNPFFGKSTHDVYDQLTAAVATLHGAITDAKDAVILDAHTTRDLIAGKVDAIKTVVDANAALLGDGTVGLAAIKTMLDNILANSNADTGDILNILNDANIGLAAIKTAIMDKLTVIEGKVDTIASKQTFSTRYVY